MNGLPYYKSYPRDFFEGTVGMPLELKGPYRLVVDLIYLQGGRLPDDPRYISGLLGCSVRAWNKARSALVEMGKIQANDGIISNFRADKELETLRTLQDTKRQNRAGSLKNKDLAVTAVERPSSYTEPEPEPYTTLEDKSSNADAEAFDPAAIIFSEGVKLLVAHGVTDGKARSFLGKMRKVYGDANLIAAIGKTQREGAVDPEAFIVGALKYATKPNGKPGVQSAGAFGMIPERN